MRTKATMVEGVKPCSYKKKNKRIELTSQQPWTHSSYLMLTCASSVLLRCFKLQKINEAAVKMKSLVTGIFGLVTEPYNQIFLPESLPCCKQNIIYSVPLVPLTEYGKSYSLKILSMLTKSDHVT